MIDNMHEQPRSPTAIIIGVLVALVAAILAAGSVYAGLLPTGNTGPSPTATPLPGTVLDPPKELDDFTLTGHTGEPLSLSDFRGKVVLVYFGYTFCPDVCPLTLSELKQAYKLLGEPSEQVQVLLISVDGARDTPDRLALYLDAFNPDFAGMTGDEELVREIGRQFGVFFQRRTYDGAAAYLVDHTASTFVVGPEGRLRIVYPFNTDPAIVAQGVERLLREG